MTDSNVTSEDNISLERWEDGSWSAHDLEQVNHELKDTFTTVPRPVAESMEELTWCPRCFEDE